MSRQNYYAQRRRRERQQVDGDLVHRLVQRERFLQPRLGGRKLHHVLKKELAEAGVELGRDRFFKVLSERKLLLEPKAAVFPCTTRSRHNLPVFTNQISGLEVTKANQVWVSDITYLRTQEGFMYLALITDKWSRKIVGHHCGDSLEAEGCLKALELALESLPQQARPIHHSDRGSQYCCHVYVERLQESQLRVSMTDKDHCARECDGRAGQWHSQTGVWAGNGISDQGRCVRSGSPKHMALQHQEAAHSTGLSSARASAPIWFELKILGMDIEKHKKDTL